MTLKTQLNKDIQAANEVTRKQRNTDGTTLLSLPNNVWRLIFVAPILIMRASASSIWYKMCTQDFLTNMAAHTDEKKKIDAL